VAGILGGGAVTGGPIPPSISVVIPTFNRCRYLHGTLAPLLAEPDALEVVVVVDGSQDGSYELLAEMAREDPRVRPVLIENRGMTEARLAGARAAEGEIVLLLDDDVRLEPGVVRGHARAHSARSDLVVVGAMPVAGGPQSGPRDYPRVMYAREYEQHCARWTAHPDNILNSFWEGNVSLRRDRLLALPPPAPAEFGLVYHTDRDFGLRCQRAGLTGVYDEDLRAWHHYSRSPAQFLSDARRSGRGLVVLHEAHPRVLGPFTDDTVLVHVPAAVRPLLLAGARRPRIGFALDVAVRVLGRVRLYRLQRFAAQLRRVIEQLRAARAVQRIRRATGGA
jgi:glycosyltransferase involved in cell wall biosynthesis